MEFTFSRELWLNITTGGKAGAPAGIFHSRVLEKGTWSKWSLKNSPAQTELARFMPRHGEQEGVSKRHHSLLKERKQVHSTWSVRRGSGERRGWKANSSHKLWGFGFYPMGIGKPLKDLKYSETIDRFRGERGLLMLFCCSCVQWEYIFGRRMNEAEDCMQCSWPGLGVWKMGLEPSLEASSVKHKSDWNSSNSSPRFSDEMSEYFMWFKGLSVALAYTLSLFPGALLFISDNDYKYPET